MKEIAQAACDYRNKIRTETRSKMDDQMLATALNLRHPNMSFEALEKKYIGKGFREGSDELYEEIVNSSMRSNKNANKMSGIK